MQGKRPEQVAYSEGMATGCVIGFLVCLACWIVTVVGKHFNW